MTRIRFSIWGISTFLVMSIVLLNSTSSVQGQGIPNSWQAEWTKPSKEMRPMKLVHGADLTRMSEVEYFRDQCGFGGLVVNVGGPGYIRSEANWKTFVAGVKNINRAGMRIWIYDELGYPSLSAGGVVLEKDPSLVSLELVYDKDAPPNKKFEVRESYEFTHSCNSYSEARKYPNPLNPKATQVFLDVTHRRYRSELGPELYRQVEAFFTDEPSLMAINLGQIPEESRKKVPTKDPIDPNKKMLPAIPWVEGIDKRYQERYGEDLVANYGSLFYGDSAKDRKIRRIFWLLIEELNCSLFYGQIRQFCAEDPKGPVSSGHTLHEESLLHHVPMDGNKLTSLQEFDLPGLDILSSMPGIQFGAWRTAGFPSSAAFLNGSRLVMTETSDHSERLYGRKRMADLKEMDGTAAWQLGWGVTEFTLYYAVKGTGTSSYRNEKSMCDYSEFIGRCNAILRSAELVRPVILYYPVEVVQEEYCPTAEKLSLASQSKRMQNTINSFCRLGESLCRAQIPFVIVDQKRLEQIIANTAGEKGNWRTKAVCAQFSGIIYPAGVEKKNCSWRSGKLPELYAGLGDPLEQRDKMAEAVKSFAGPRLVFSGTGRESLGFGSFVRDGHLIFLVTNGSEKEYNGSAQFARPNSMSLNDSGQSVTFDGKGNGKSKLDAMSAGTWTLLDPATGETKNCPMTDGKIDLKLGSYETILLVSP